MEFNIFFSKTRYTAFASLWLSLWICNGLSAGGTSSGEEYRVTLLPGLKEASRDGSKRYWQFVRPASSDSNGNYELEGGFNGNGALYIEQRSDAGYAEWRPHPHLVLQPGKSYHFSVMVRSRSDVAPHLEVFSFDKNGEPHRLALRYGVAGHSDWSRLSAEFLVPGSSSSVRLAFGLTGKGKAWFSEPELNESNVSMDKKRSQTQEAILPRDWQANWIWIDQPSAVASAVFRKNFFLEQLPAYAFVQITADDEYYLEVNGIEIGNDTTWSNVQRYEITDTLNQGDNIIEALVDNFDGAAGLLVEALLIFSDGSEKRIVTDGSWNVRLAEDTEGKNWMKAIELGKPPVQPWGNRVNLAPFVPPKPAPVEIVGQTQDLRPGDVWQLRFKWPEMVPPEELTMLELYFVQNNERVAISPYEFRVISEYKVRGSTIQSLEPFEGINQNEGTIVLELAVSDFVQPGAYNWVLDTGAYRLSPLNPGSELRISPSLLPRTEQAIAWPGYASNSLPAHEGIQSPFTYTTTLPSVESYQKWQATGGHQYEVSIQMERDWNKDGKWKLESVERNMMMILEADPLASIYLRIRLDMPSWWLRANPDDVFISNKETRGLQSFASDKWREDSIDAVLKLWNTLKDKPVGSALAGVVLMGFKGGEFQLWGEADGLYDCSSVAQNAFVDYQIGIGVGDPVHLPHPALEYPFQKGEGYDEIRKHFFSFIADRQADNLIELVNGIKASAKDDISIGTYFGYAMEHAGSLRRLLYASHLAGARFYREAELDFVGCPASYSMRGTGNPHAFMYPVTSVRLNAIQPLIEDDVRNFAVGYLADSSGRTLQSLREAQTSIEKIRYLAATQGAIVRQYSLVNSGDTFQPTEIISKLNRLNSVIQLLEPSVIGEDEKVVYIIDNKALVRAPEIENANEIVRTYLSEIRKPLASLGTGVSYVFFDDWLENRDKWELAIFPFSSLVFEEREDEFKRMGLSSANGSDSGVFILTANDWVYQESVDGMMKFLQSRYGKSKSGYGYHGGNFKAIYDGKRVWLD